jgi:hypothetical protein
MTNTNTTQPKAKPIFRKQLPGGISSAVFENHRDGRTYRSVNLQRSYRKDGKWNRMSMYLDHADIPFMIEVLQGTWNFLNGHLVSNLNAAEPAEATESETTAEAQA